MWFGRAAICLVALPITSCGGDANSLPKGEWNRLATILDMSPGIRYMTPALERGSTVHGRVEAGEVEVSSSNTAIFEVLDTEQRKVGYICSDSGTCVDDVRTYFRLRARELGSAELIVEALNGDSRRLPVDVSERSTIEVIDFETREPVVDVDVTADITVLELLIRDQDAKPLVTHATWTLEDTQAVEFVVQDADPRTSLFIEGTARRFEGPLPLVFATRNGESTLNVETGGGASLSVPVHAAAQ